MEWVTPERLLWSAQFFRLARVALKTMEVFVTSSQLTSRLPEKRAAEETNLLMPVGARAGGGEYLVGAGGGGFFCLSLLRIHPGLAFGDIHFHAAFERMIRRTIGLHPRLHAVPRAPLPVSAGESFTE